MAKEIIQCDVTGKKCDQPTNARCNTCPHARLKIGQILDAFVSDHHSSKGRRDIAPTRGFALQGYQTIHTNNKPARQMQVFIKNGRISETITEG
ncbi:hypothetical protein IPM62_01805 [Candidatus Woesebacteria bacterium]|nr:MAG: hypothetical protein IPM62_01805 [Candidatus Woesebacteria bacterium]